MAVVVPIRLIATTQTSNIVRVISLYPPVPAWQNSIEPTIPNFVQAQNFTRDTSLVSFGFPHSLNIDPDVVQPTDPVYPIPPNAYTIVKPSQAFGSLALNQDGAYSVLLIDTTVCPVEPGFSRIRIDYVDLSFNTRAEYYDMPFYETWDVHPTEIQQIVDFAEGINGFIQAQANAIQGGVFNSLQRELMKGLSVSGTLCASQSNATFNPINPKRLDYISFSKEMKEVFITAKLAQSDVIAADTKEIDPKTVVLGHYQLLTYPASGIFGGDTFSVIIDQSTVVGDQIYLGNIPLLTTLNGNTLTAILPRSVAFGFQTTLRIGNSGAIKSNTVAFNVLALPKIYSITGSAPGFGLVNGNFTITGKNFGSIQGTTSIIFTPNVSATITSWSSSQITGIVPLKAANGLVTLKTGANKIASIGINIQNPYINDIFDINPKNNVVMLNSVTTFNATLNSVPVSSVYWSLRNDTGNIGSGNVATGKIDQHTGIYVAPSQATAPFNIDIIANYLGPHGNYYNYIPVMILPSANTTTISPSAIIVNPSHTAMFKIMHNNAVVNNGVTWYVNGVLGGNFDFGFINLYGLYQAPADVYQLSSVNITGVCVFGTATALISFNSTVITQSHDIIFNKSGPSSPNNPFLTSVTSACPGQNVVVTGQYFPPDSVIKFYGSNIALPTTTQLSTVDGINYNIGVQIPTSVTNNASVYSIYLSSISSGNSNVISLVVPTGCGLPTIIPTLIVTPQNINIGVGVSQQFNAILELSNGTSQDVSSSASWFVQNVSGGNSGVGTISAGLNAALYVAPLTIPSPNPVAIEVITYYNGNPVLGYAYVTIVAPSSPPVPYQNVPVGSCYLLTVSPSTATVSVPGPTVQFIANVSVDGGSAVPVLANQWFVNGIAGGDSVHGTIDVNGVYTPPTCYVPSDFMNTTIGAELTVIPPSNNPAVISGYAIITYAQTSALSGTCNISVDSQININFGDGRIGYIPTTSAPIALVPGNYLLASYNETLDINLNPINVGNSQLMILSQHSAQANDLAQILYDEGTLFSNINTGGYYTRVYTVVLGICDPTSGLFQSMWDLIPVLQPINNVIVSQPLSCTMTHSFHGDELVTKNIQSIDTIINNDNQIIDISSVISKNHSTWIGQIVYQNQTLLINKSITFMEYNLEEKLYLKYVMKNESFIIKDKEILIGYRKRAKWLLKVVSLDDILLADSTTYILGIVLNGKFYSKYAFLTVKNEAYPNFNEIDNSNTKLEQIRTILQNFKGS